MAFIRIVDKMQRARCPKKKKWTMRPVLALRLLGVDLYHSESLRYGGREDEMLDADLVAQAIVQTPRVLPMEKRRELLKKGLDKIKYLAYTDLGGKLHRRTRGQVLDEFAHRTAGEEIGGNDD